MLSLYCRKKVVRDDALSFESVEESTWWSSKCKCVIVQISGFGPCLFDLNYITAWFRYDAPISYNGRLGSLGHLVSTVLNLVFTEKGNATKRYCRE